MFWVCGEALFDVFVGPDTPGGVALDARIGGSGFNVAAGLARLGQTAALVTGLSTDMLGARLLRALEVEGVATTHLVRKPGPTTLALVGIGPDGGPTYAFHGAGAADRAVTPADLPKPDAAVTALMFGCLSLVTEPTGSSFLGLARQARGGPLVTLDPNVRLSVLPDIAAWRARIAAFAACADLVKLSAEDHAALYPGEAPAATAARWIADGVRLVVLTEGAAGARAFTASGTLAIAAPAITVVDTVGAGDSFLAGLAATLAERGVRDGHGLADMDGDTLAASLGFAMRAAAVTCSRRGADLPRRSDLDR